MMDEKTMHAQAERLRLCRKPGLRVEPLYHPVPGTPGGWAIVVREPSRQPLDLYSVHNVDAFLAGTLRGFHR